MALPALSEVRAIAVEWWREPGRRRIDALRARMAAAVIGEPRTSVHVRLEDRPLLSPPLALAVEFARWDENGQPLPSIMREWIPDASDRPGADLLDVVEDGDKRSRRQRLGDEVS